MRRLDYLHGLGVTAIWLMPFQASPGRDDGYDIADYYGVDPRYGTLGDFVEFTHGCRAARHPRHHRSRGQPHLRPASLVPGGAQRSRRRSIATGTSGRRRSRPTPTRAWSFPACRNRPGATTSSARAWYFHRFYDFQPDLNTSNPEVQAEILKIMGFWIQLGVSGFRMDAVPFVIATKGAEGHRTRSSNTTCCARSANSCSGARATPSSWRRPTCCPTPTWSISASDGDRMQMMFNFQVNQHLFYALATADTRPLAKALKATKPRPATAQWGLFLRNHDELDLGRLTKAQREAVFAAFGPEPGHAALRSRHPPPPGADAGRRPPAAGAGLQPDVHAAGHAGRSATATRSAWATISRLPERNCARTPMQWSTEPHAGFTESDKPAAAGHRPAAPTAISMSTSPSSGAIRTRC